MTTPKGNKTLDARKRRLMRYGQTKATARFGIGGAEKIQHKPRPITLAKVDIAPVKP